MHARCLFPIALVLAVALSACDSSTTASVTHKPYEELLNQGAAKYLGLAAVATSTTAEGVTTYEFSTKSGPMCLRGDPFRMAVRDGDGDNLLIFLQGGGACWSTFCLAIQKAPPGIPVLDVLDVKRSDNPWRTWSVAYAPYCDGSLFAGDAEHDDDGDGKIDRYQYGLRNLSATLDIAKQRFPHPKHIALVGSSGGGFGTILATVLVRAQYPDADIAAVEDSGVGIGKPDEPKFMAQLIDEFAARPFIPKSCPECIGAGHLTRLVDWELKQDPKLRIAAFSSYEDQIMTKVFLKIDPASFHKALLDETAKVHADHPGRYQRFLIAGAMHTTLLGDASGLIGNDISAVVLPTEALDALGGIELGSISKTQVRGVTMAQWLAAMRDGTAAWDDRVE